MTKAEQYALDNFEYAYKAYIANGVHPLVTLAQGANESGYGTSNIARTARNHFGITKGSTWQGETYHAVSTGLYFRVYPSVADSYTDFGNLIQRLYPECAAVSNNLEAYASAISQSRYIAEENGDNRAQYAANITSIGRAMASVVAEQLQKKKR